MPQTLNYTPPFPLLSCYSCKKTLNLLPSHCWPSSRATGSTTPRYTGRSQLNYISSGCSWVRWFCAKAYYKLSLPPMPTAKQELLPTQGGKGWWRSVDVPALQDKCGYSQRQIWGTRCPSLSLQPDQCRVLRRAACLRWLWLYLVKFYLWFSVFISSGLALQLLNNCKCTFICVRSLRPNRRQP